MSCGEPGPRGWLHVQYTVFCGCCPNWEYVQGKKCSEAGQDARKRGWRYTLQRGWICPQCQESEEEGAQT